MEENVGRQETTIKETPTSREMARVADANYSGMTLGFVAGVGVSIIATIMLIVTKLA